jgi:hypothetical protein
VALIELDTLAAQAARRLEETKIEQSRLISARRLRLINEIAEARTDAAKLRAQIAAIADKRAYVSRLGRTAVPLDDVRSVDIVIARVYDDAVKTLPAQLDTKIHPGDIVTVKLPNPLLVPKFDN